MSTCRMVRATVYFFRLFICGGPEVAPALPQLRATVSSNCGQPFRASSTARRCARATYRSTSSRRAISPRAPARECGARRPWWPPSSRPWPDSGPLPSRPSCPLAAPAIASCRGSVCAGARRLVGRLLEPLDLRFQRVDPVEHLLQGPRQGIRQIRLVEIDGPGYPLAVAECYATGHPHHNTVLRHLAHHHRAGSDPAPRPDGERADDLGPRPDHHIVADGGVALLALDARAPEGDPLQDADVPADLGGLADDHAHAVVDEEPRPQHRGGVDLDAGQEAAHVGHEAGGQSPPAAPERVSHAVAPDRVHARVAQHHLERRASRRVALPHRPHVLPHPIKHSARSLSGPGRARHARPPAAPAPRPPPRDAAHPAAHRPPPRRAPPAARAAPRARTPSPPRSPRSPPRSSARSRRPGTAPPPPGPPGPAGGSAPGPCTPCTPPPRPRRDPASAPRSGGSGSGR